MDAKKLQESAARDQLWASLRVLVPEIQRLADGEFGDTERERQLIQLMARIVTNEMQFRAEQSGEGD
jgi:hypothetical protein